MKRLHYSTEIRREMTGRKKRVRHPLTKDQKSDLFTFFYMLAIEAAFIASLACYIGLL